MKKMIVCLITLIIILSLSACSSGTQKISFQGINMEIPASWKADKHSISEDYAIYETLNKKGTAPFERFFLLQAVYWLGLRSDKVTGKAPMRSHNRTEEKGCTEKTS